MSFAFWRVHLWLVHLFPALHQESLGQSPRGLIISVYFLPNYSIIMQDFEFFVKSFFGILVKKSGLLLPPKEEKNDIISELFQEK